MDVGSTAITTTYSSQTPDWSYFPKVAFLKVLLPKLSLKDADAVAKVCKSWHKIVQPEFQNLWNRFENRSIFPWIRRGYIIVEGRDLVERSELDALFKNNNEQVHFDFGLARKLLKNRGYNPGFNALEWITKNCFKGKHLGNVELPNLEKYILCGNDEQKGNIVIQLNNEIKDRQRRLKSLAKEDKELTLLRLERSCIDLIEVKDSYKTSVKILKYIEKILKYGFSNSQFMKDVSVQRGYISIPTLTIKTESDKGKILITNLNGKIVARCMYKVIRENGEPVLKREFVYNAVDKKPSEGK